MTTTARTTKTTANLGLPPDVYEVIEKAARAVPEEKGLPQETVEAMHAAGLFRALAPAEVGGGQCGVMTAFELVEQVSRADGSAGWALMAGMTTLAIAGAFLGDDAVTDVFSDPRAVTAGQVAPLGTARPVGDGFEVEGRFGFSSGSQHASWIFGGFREQLGGEPVKLPNGMPNVLAALVPKEKVEFLGNWDVLGLQHTYSEDYQVPLQHVPAAYVFPVFTATPLRGGPAYGIGVNGLTCVAHAAWACGVAGRALDELHEQLVARRHPTRKTLIDDGHFQHQYALARVRLRAARSNAKSSLQELEVAASNGRLTLELRGHARLATTHACAEAVRATTLAYGFSGQTGLRRGVLQQCYLDISAGEQHVFTDHNSVVNAGKVLLGVAAPDMFF